jgi:hypothetical protein
MKKKIVKNCQKLKTLQKCFRREKINPVRTMFNTAIKITDRMGDPIKKKKKKKKSFSCKKSLTIRSHHRKDKEVKGLDLDVGCDDEDDDDQVTVVSTKASLLSY